MKPDDELCLCFHVTRRKVENYIRIERPRRVGQLAECYGAGTGCGWCRPFLQRLFDRAQAGSGAQAGQGGAAEAAVDDLPTAEEYAHDRSDYVRAGGGTPPPGATPIE